MEEAESVDDDVIDLVLQFKGSTNVFGIFRKPKNRPNLVDSFKRILLPKSIHFFAV